MGIIVSVGFWPMLMGLRKSKELLFTGNTIGAAEAERWGLINRAVPLDKLEEEVNKLADDICKISVEQLTLLKKMTNRWFELMGLHSAFESTAEYNLISHRVPKFEEMWKMLREKGLKETMAARDGQPKKQDQGGRPL